jgi:hypothetical protein
MCRVFEMGDLIEGYVKRLLRDAGYGVTGEQAEYSDFGGRFLGHCDGVISGVTRRDHVLEIKSASDSRFKGFAAKGPGYSPAYAAQLQCYMGYSGLERALFVVMNKNTQALLDVRVRFDPDAFAALKAKAARILAARWAPEPDTSDCYFCPFRGGACESEPRLPCGDCRYRVRGEHVPWLARKAADGGAGECALDGEWLCVAGALGEGADPAAGCAAHERV